MLVPRHVTSMHCKRKKKIKLEKKRKETLEIKKGGSNKERKKIRVEESYKGESLTRAQFIKRNRHAIKIK